MSGWYYIEYKDDKPPEKKPVTKCTICRMLYEWSDEEPDCEQCEVRKQ